MSRRKHLMQSMDQGVEPPGEGQHIVRAAGSRGSNIIEVEFPDGRSTLCLLPAKFHKKLWVRKGSYLIVEDAPEAGGEGSRVTGQIAAVLYADHVKELRRMPGVWPPEFEVSSSGGGAAGAAAAAEQLAALGIAESDHEQQGGAAAAAAGSSSAAGAAGGQRAGGGGDGGAAGPSAAAAAASTACGGEAGGAAGGEGGGGYTSSSEDDLPPIPKFNNRKVIEYEVSESEEESD